MRVAAAALFVACRLCVQLLRALQRCMLCAVSGPESGPSLLDLAAKHATPPAPTLSLRGDAARRYAQRPRSTTRCPDPLDQRARPSTPAPPVKPSLRPLLPSSSFPVSRSAVNLQARRPLTPSPLSVQAATCPVPNLPRHVPSAGGPVGSPPAPLPRPTFSQGEVDAVVAAGRMVVERRDSKTVIGAAALRAARKRATRAAPPMRPHAPPAAINSGDVWAIGCALSLALGCWACCRAAPVCSAVSWSHAGTQTAAWRPSTAS